ncbi:glycerate kinase [Natronosporangium hydrolyticum]|uniref:Glycerate kinase n=1 Tax=Natronosporangium hydrolyticum TaxID=2811111 RepID=A0A895YDK7_9ACTN|nr:glycerate kinase [Natronosporangium hydrolyticum]QSB13533.1 glycerate kinase [Natronosporangium hydrolyticum]
MRVLICPDKFAGTLTAVAAASALAEGWREASPADQIDQRPLADGGPGFLDVLAAAAGPAAEWVPVRTVDPLGRPVPGWLLVLGDTGYVESAQACGLHLLAESERDPTVTTSYGLGLLIGSAVAGGVRRVVVGLGGSAVNDGGAGMLAALGAGPVDRAGYALPPGGAAVAAASGLAGQPQLYGAELVAATDVDNPLLGPAGASAVFGPQKGAGEAEVALLDAALAQWATVLEQQLPGCPAGLATLPGGGAAGGLGAALLALGGRVEAGMALVRRLTGLDHAIAEADLVITGEGSFDSQSLRGKVAAAVAGAARARGVPCLVVAGRATVPVTEATAAGVTGVFSLVEHFGGDAARAMAEPAAGLKELAAQIATDPPSRRS